MRHQLLVPHNLLVISKDKSGYWGILNDYKTN